VALLGLVRLAWSSKKPWLWRMPPEQALGRPRCSPEQLAGKVRERIASKA
jgi:hypothetical protein